MDDNSDFCVEMRTKTQKIHDKSDKLVNLKLAIALTDVKTYGHVIADFYYVFQAIETAMEENREHPHVRGQKVEDMLRTASFEEDVEFFLGANWRGLVHPSEAAQIYCDRVGKIAKENPTLLIA